MSTEVIAAQVERLLNELCVKLGFSEPLRHVPRFVAVATSGRDSFTDLLLSIEGLDPTVNKALHREALSLVAKRFVSWGSRGAA